MLPRNPGSRAATVVAPALLYTLLAAISGRGLDLLPLAVLAVALAGLWWRWTPFTVAAATGAGLLAGAFLQESHVSKAHLAGLVSLLLVAAALSFARMRLMRARATLDASAEGPKAFIEKSLAGVLIYRNREIVYANGRLQELTGYGREEVVGRPFEDFVHEEDRPAIRAKLAEREAGNSHDLRYECRLLSKKGQVLWVDIVSSSIEWEDGPAFVVSAYDITEREEVKQKRRELSRLAQRQEEQLVHSTRLAEMGEMAAGIAHELNQPLTGIKNYAKNAVYMLEQQTGRLDEVEENLHLISKQVDRASKIISQMRELAHRSERQMQCVDVNKCVRETVEFVMPQLRLSGVEAVLTLADELPEVMGDGIRLEQVFLNLLTNARQAMEDCEERRLYVSTRYEPESSQPVVVEIRDTGKGFPPDMAEKLFAPFYSTKKVRHGTGLGLSISLSIIKDHKGAIEAMGTEGHGAIFTVRLPTCDGEVPDDSQARKDG